MYNKYSTFSDLLDNINAHLKQYQNFLVHFIPHVQITSEPSHKKRKSCERIAVPKFSAIFNSRVYSYVGSRIHRRDEAEFSQEILDAIITKEGEHHSDLDSFSALQRAIALLQLLQDENRVKNKLPAVGYWVEQLLGYEAVATISSERLYEACLVFVNSLIKACVFKIEDNNTIDSISENVYVVGDLSLSEIGFLVLCAIIPIEEMREVKTFNRCAVGLNVSKIFVPVCQTRHNAAWKSIEEIFTTPPEIFNTTTDLKGMVDSCKDFILVPLENKELLKEWAISCMLSNAFEYLGDKNSVKNHHLDIQLVFEKSTQRVCVQIWNATKGHDLTDLEDAVYMEQYNDPAFEFIAFNMALYLRMLLYIDPNYRLLDPYKNSYFIFTSRECDTVSKVYFIAHAPTKNKSQKEEELMVNEINNFISKFIIKNSWYDRDSRTGYNIDDLQSLFEIALIVNNEEVVRAGAEFIAKILQVEEQLKKKENLMRKFVKFSQTPKQAMKSFDVIFNKYKR